MLRSFLISVTAVAVLGGCQMQDTGPQVTTREERLQIAQDVIQNCERSRCQLLNLDSKLVEDYAQVARLDHVTSLMASFSEFNDLGAIAPMTQLTELHIGYTQLVDISGLSAFPNLRLLHVQGNAQVSDFSVIGRMQTLEELAIGRNDLGNAGFLRNLRRLKSLSLDGADISSLEALRGHPTLEVLDLTNADLPADLSVLRSIANLREVSVAEWDLTPQQKAIMDALSAQGVNVMYAPVVIVC